MKGCGRRLRIGTSGVDGFKHGPDEVDFRLFQSATCWLRDGSAVCCCRLVTLGAAVEELEWLGVHTVLFEPVSVDAHWQHGLDVNWMVCACCLRGSTTWTAGYRSEGL